MTSDEWRECKQRADNILAAVLERELVGSGMTFADLQWHGRGTESKMATRHRVWRAPRASGLSYPAIGKMFGVRHSTVYMALKKGNK